MYLKVKYDHLQDTGTFFISKSDEIDDLMEEMKSLSQELKSYWDGTDYEQFMNRYNQRIKEATATSIELNALGNALNKVSALYQGIDTDFGNKVQRMRKDKDEK